MGGPSVIFSAAFASYFISFLSFFPSSFFSFFGKGQLLVWLRDGNVRKTQSSFEHSSYTWNVLANCGSNFFFRRTRSGLEARVIRVADHVQAARRGAPIKNTRRWDRVNFDLRTRLARSQDARTASCSFLVRPWTTENGSIYITVICHRTKISRFKNPRIDPMRSPPSPDREI